MVNVQINNPFQISVPFLNPPKEREKSLNTLFRVAQKDFPKYENSKHLRGNRTLELILTATFQFAACTCMEKTTIDTHSRLSGSCKFCSFKLSLNLSLTNFRAQINFNEIFHDSLKTSKFARVCVENRWTVTGGKSYQLFSPYQSF